MNLRFEEEMKKEKRKNLLRISIFPDCRSHCDLYRMAGGTFCVKKGIGSGWFHGNYFV